MKIAVCIKQVPDTEARLRLNKQGTWIDEADLPFVINESDECALEQALQIREKSTGEVVAFSLGPERVREALRKALALGADRAVHLLDPAFALGDPIATSRALAAAVSREPFDLVLTGSQSDDLGWGVTASLLAAHLGLPHAWLVMGIELDGEGKTARVVREMEAGKNEIFRVRLPAVLEVQAGINHPRYASLKGIMAAKRKEIASVGRADLGLAENEAGAAGSRVEILSVEFPRAGQGAQIIEGDASTAATKLVDLLRSGSEGAVMAGVWAILQHREGKIHPGSWEAVTAAKRIAEAVGEQAEAVVFGSGIASLAAEAARSGVATLRVADHEALADYVPGPYAAALVAALRQTQPRFVVFPHTYQSVDYMARVAHGYGAGVLSEVVALQAGPDGLVWTRPILEGKLQAKARVRGDGPMVVSVQAGAFPAADRSGAAAPIEALAVDAAALAPERELLGIEDAATDVVDLTASERIVSVGRGIGGPEKLGIIHDLAAALGAEIGASRPVIDNGWLPRDRQIGSSGQTVAPKLYVAVGISGAIQHLVGMKGAGCTVAINKDPGAPIFNVADYGIVGDLFEIVPALIKALRESRPA